MKKKLSMILAVLMVVLSVVPAVEVLAAGLLSRSSGHTIRFMDTDVYITVPKGFRLDEKYENSVCYDYSIGSRVDTLLWFWKVPYRSMADWQATCESKYTNVSAQTINGIETVTATVGDDPRCYFNRGESSYYFEYMLGDELANPFESTLNSLQIIAPPQATPAATATPTPKPIENEEITLWILHSGVKVSLPLGYKSTKAESDVERWENGLASIVFSKVEYKDLSEWKTTLRKVLFYKDYKNPTFNGIELVYARTKNSDATVGIVECYFNSGYSTYKISYGYAGSWTAAQHVFDKILNTLTMECEPTATPVPTPTPTPTPMPTPTPKPTPQPSA